VDYHQRKRRKVHNYITSAAKVLTNKKEKESGNFGEERKMMT
jgi:hypothetical protein